MRLIPLHRRYDGASLRAKAEGKLPASMKSRLAGGHRAGCRGLSWGGELRMPLRETIAADERHREPKAHAARSSSAPPRDGRA